MSGRERERESLVYSTEDKYLLTTTTTFAYTRGGGLTRTRHTPRSECNLGRIFTKKKNRAQNDGYETDMSNSIETPIDIDFFWSY